MALREELRRADEQPLLDEEITRLFLGDADEGGHDVGDEAELLDAVVPPPTDVDQPESVGVLPTVESVDHEVQPPDRLPVVVPEHGVRALVLADGVMGGQPRIEGRRISVLQIVEWVHEEGMEPETVAAEFDLDMAEIHRALAYYYENIESMATRRDRRHRRLRESREDHPDPDSLSEHV